MFDVPVKQRSRIQRNAVVHFWRNRNRFHLGPQATPTLYFDGKKVVKKSSTASLLGETFHEAKSGGCKKIRYRNAESFVGLSERNILRVTNSEVRYRDYNAKFTNKATPKPVAAKHVHPQHQINLIDLSREHVRHNGKIYKYVLTVLDVFSRFLWLSLLERKTSDHVRRPLTRIYSEHGPPDRLQSDCGPECAGNVWTICKKIQNQTDQIEAVSPAIPG